jgi:two-component system NarL family sensor kinase
MNTQTESPTRLQGSWLFSARLAWLLFTLTCIWSALSFVFLALSWATPVPDIYGFRGEAVILALAFGSIGLLLVRRQPQNPIGWLLLAAGLANAIVEFCIEYAIYALLTKSGALPYGTLAAWIASWLWIIAIDMLIYAFLLFPTGHLPSVRWRPVAWFVAGAFALMAFAFMIRPGSLYFAPYQDNPFAVQVVYPVLSLIPVANAGALLIIGISIILRFWRAEGIERQQLKWFASAATLKIIIGLTYSVASAAGLKGMDPKFYQYLTVATWIAVSLAIAFSILRYRLWDIDIIISRTLVYGALTACIVALYILLVGALSLLSQTTGNLLISLLATGLIAFLFQPLRERLQRGVNRLMYGERDDPYAVLSRLGQRLEAAYAPESVFPTITETVAQTLKLPYVAIALNQNGEFKIAAEFGRSKSEPIHLPLNYQGEPVGELRLALRAPGEHFMGSERQLLDDLARQAGVAAHAVRLTADLQRSRERLVSAREEERRRLRRDLHDGLGPQLASLTLKLETARNRLTDDPLADSLLADLAKRTQDATADIRRLVYELRPPTLDELGLVSALREGATQYSQQGFNGVHITIDAPENLPPLPAAVEVAVYRIIQEALTNVVRHAEAHTCNVRITMDEQTGWLSLEIQDDGRGLSSTRRAGVGLNSMRERAEELGGTWTIESLPAGGTRILVRLPCRLPDHTQPKKE